MGVSKKRELTAYEKLLLCQEAGSRSPEVSEQKHWKQLSEKYGLSVPTLKDYSSKKAVWQTLVEKNKLHPKSRAARKAKRTCRYMRQKGAGRKADFPELLPALKQWHATERQHGHSVSRQDFFAEYVTLLVQESKALLQEAERLPHEDPQKHSLQKLAKLALDRKSKLLSSKKYRNSLTDRLVRDSGAKFSISHRGEGARSADFAGLNRALWAMTCASTEALTSEKLVADCLCRELSQKTLCGMSDQIPLWAKAQPKKLLFSEAELSEVLPGGGDSLREELRAARTALENTLGEDGPPSEKQASDSKLKPGSKVQRAHSEADKFRITYEARQKIRGLCGDGTEPSAEVSSGLLVFPGRHCRLSNLDSEGRYISMERYRVGNSEVVHLSGEKCRSLKWAVRLRSLYPQEFSEIDIMQQPASNVDGVLLNWVVQGQGSEEPCSLYIRDSFAAIFSSEVRRTRVSSRPLLIRT